MPRRSLTLSIPQPCSESWAAMTPAAQGRHCAACDKVVVDFTRMTDAEVVAWLQRQSGKICGRFSASQLARPLLAATATPRWRRWLAVAAVALITGKFAATEAQAQRAKIHVRAYPLPDEISPVVVPPAPANQPRIVSATESFLLHGTLLDSASREPLSGVTVLLINSNIGDNTSEDGTFEFRVPLTVKPNQQIIFSQIGYVRETLSVSQVLENSAPILLSVDSHLLGEVNIVQPRKPRPWYMLRSLWHHFRNAFSH